MTAKAICDVLVVGSGSSALTAALRLATAGKTVVVVEKTDKLGGTSAMSGAGMWVPANPAMLAAGLQDSPDDAVDYIRAVSPAGWSDIWEGHWRSLMTAGPRMIEFLEANTPLRFTMTTEHDPYADASGAWRLGRMISTQPLSRWRLGRRAFQLRRSTLPEIFTYHEAVSLDLFHRPVRTILSRLPQLALRFATNTAGRGQSLLIGLISACARRGVALHVGSPATALLTGDGRVVGAEIGGRFGGRIQVRDGVIIASGGFEWDAAMRDCHFKGVNGFNASSPGNSGDGQKMGQAIGAWLDNMEEATIHPCLPALYEGKVQGVPLPFHTEANTIIVDSSGRRFTNEQAFNIGEVLNRRDASSGLPLHAPAWLIADAEYLKGLPIVRRYLRSKPDWLVKASTIEELAKRIAVPPDALAQSVARFNEDCRSGRDRDFGRTNGQSEAVDRRKRTGIAPITTSPFLALPVNRCYLGTKGGLRTDPQGRVLDVDGQVIPGLFAAGAAAASPIGTRAVGAGTTIGPYMASGYVCATTLLGIGNNDRGTPVPT